VRWSAIQSFLEQRMRTREDEPNDDGILFFHAAAYDIDVYVIDLETMGNLHLFENYMVQLHNKDHDASFMNWSTKVLDHILDHLDKCIVDMKYTGDAISYEVATAFLFILMMSSTIKTSKNATKINIILDKLAITQSFDKVFVDSKYLGEGKIFTKETIGKVLKTFEFDKGFMHTAILQLQEQVGELKEDVVELKDEVILQGDAVVALKDQVAGIAKGQDEATEGLQGLQGQVNDAVVKVNDSEQKYLTIVKSLDHLWAFLLSIQMSLNRLWAVLGHIFTLLTKKQEALEKKQVDNEKQQTAKDNFLARSVNQVYEWSAQNNVNIAAHINELQASVEDQAAVNEKLGDRITGVANSNLKKMLVVNASSALVSARVLNLETTVAQVNQKVDEKVA